MYDRCMVTESVSKRNVLFQLPYAIHFQSWSVRLIIYDETLEKRAKKPIIKVKNLGSKVLTRRQGEEVKSFLLGITPAKDAQFKYWFKSSGFHSSCSFQEEGTLALQLLIVINLSYSPSVLFRDCPWLILKLL